jgi:hypothetical protein
MYRCGSRITLPALTLLVAVLLIAVPAAAGPRDHQDGLFLRLSAGGGSGSSSIEDITGEVEISGSVADVNIAIGAIITPNLALHGTLMGWSAQDPDLVFNGTTIGEINGDVTATGIGGGLTYFFMPVNMYLSGSLGVGSMELDAGNLSVETDSGLFADLTLGKEWWVGEKWALGLAGGVTIHSFSDPDVDENWSGTSFCLRFSASMN